MVTVTLPLMATEYDKQVIEKRFRALSRIHNVVVKRAKKLIKKLQYDKEYNECLTEYVGLLKKSKLTREESSRKRELSKQMNKIRFDMGLTEYGLQSYITKCRRRYATCLSSMQVQKEATRVWKGIEKVLFGDGKELHFKKQLDFDSIGGKNNTNGSKFDKESLSISWLGLEMKCKLPKRDKDAAYIKRLFEYDISYCEIGRKMFQTGWHYYAIVYLKGPAPKKLLIDNENVTGIDPGISTVAAVSDDSAVLRELAPLSKDYNRKIAKVQLQMDRSRRQSNPNKYNEDGTIKKGNKEKWKFSKSYFKKRCQMRYLHRAKTDHTRHTHNKLANDILCMSGHKVIVEHMDFKALQKRSKKTAERSDKQIEVKRPDGTTTTVFKNKKKKRFGKSINDRSPSLFLTILKRKCDQYAILYFEVNTKTFKASQYDHTTGECIKSPLSQREKVIGGHPVQRDLYSAFLIRNSNDDYTLPDRDKCNQNFVSFIQIHNETINQMKQTNISMKQCFGF